MKWWPVWKQLLTEHQLKDQVELTGTFCIGRCQEGVCVLVDGEFCSVSPAIHRCVL